MSIAIRDCPLHSLCNIRLCAEEAMFLTTKSHYGPLVRLCISSVVKSENSLAGN